MSNDYKTINLAEKKMKCTISFNSIEELNNLEHAIDFMPVRFWNDSIKRDIKFIRERLFNLPEREDGTFRTRFNKELIENVDWAFANYYVSTKRFMVKEMQDAILNLFEDK